MRGQLSHRYETTNKIISSVNFYLYTYQKQMGKDSGPNIIQQHPPSPSSTSSYFLRESDFDLLALFPPT